jgi:hypothetical protein
MSMLTLYFLVKLDSLSIFFGWNVFILTIITITVGFSFLYFKIESNNDCWNSTTIEDYKDKADQLRGYLKKFFISWFIVFFIFMAIPTTKEIAFIYVVGTMSQAESSKRIGEEVVKIPEKALQILNYQLDEYMEQFKPKGVSNK